MTVLILKRTGKSIIRAWMSERLRIMSHSLMEAWKNGSIGGRRKHIFFQWRSFLCRGSLYINGVLWLCDRFPLGWRVRLVRLRISAHSPNREHQSWFRYPRHFFFSFSFTGNAAGPGVVLSLHNPKSIGIDRSLTRKNREMENSWESNIFPYCRGQ